MRYINIGIYTLLYIVTIGILVASILLKPHAVESTPVSIIRSVIVCFAMFLLARYTLYMFCAPWAGSRKSKRQVNLACYEPLVSVMIPAWNEEVGLLGTVKTILASTYRRIEIIVVNDGSTDGSDALMREFADKYNEQMRDVPNPMRIIYCYQPNGGKGSALNTAISLSHGDIFVSIDADCVVHERAIEAFVQAFADPKVMAAVGNVKVGNTQTVLGIIQTLEFRFSFYLKRSDSLLGSVYIIGGAAGAFRREVFARLGGYSTTNITEDIHMSMRVQDAGWKIMYVPEALVYTEGASTLAGLLKQRLRWKRGRFQTFWEHRHMFFSLEPRHNKLLCWIILPTTLLSEVQLGLEPLFLLILYIFSFVSGDFSGFLSGVAVVSLMFFIQAWDAKEEQDSSYLWLAPIGWLLFYVCSFVEVYALIKSLWMMARRKELTWQKWQRKGVVE